MAKKKIKKTSKVKTLTSEPKPKRKVKGFPSDSKNVLFFKTKKI